jgi:hypothetical protein
VGCSFGDPFAATPGLVSPDRVVATSAGNADSGFAVGGFAATTFTEASFVALQRPTPTPVARSRTAAAAAPSQILDPNLRWDGRANEPPP